MNYIKKFVIPSFITIGIFALLLVLRTVPTAKLWKGFSVLYVPCDTDAKVVMTELQNAGCEDVISFYNQRIPFVNQFLPIKSDSNDSYLSGRNSYFFDKDRTVTLYYIPDRYSGHAKNACENLIKKHSINAGLDSKSSFPLLTPVICILAMLFLFIYAKKKFIFLTASLFPIIFTFTMPFYTNAACVCLYLYAAFLAQKIWKRKGSIDCLKNNFYVIILVAASLAGTFFSSFVSGLMFMLCLTASILLLFVLSNYETYKDSKLRFCPVLIRNARLMNMVNPTSIKKALIPIGSILILFVLYISSVNIFTAANSGDLSFPMPTRYNVETGIPNLNDYIVWNWNVVTKPYKSLNTVYSDFPEEGESVVIQRFKDSDDGVIATEEVLYCFDDSFRKEAVSLIDDLQYPAIEKLMKNQESGFNVDYSYGAGEKFSLVNIILMVVLFIIPCALMIVYRNGRRYGNAN